MSTFCFSFPTSSFAFSQRNCFLFSSSLPSKCGNTHLSLFSKGRLRHRIKKSSRIYSTDLNCSNKGEKPSNRAHSHISSRTKVFSTQPRAKNLDKLGRNNLLEQEPRTSPISLPIFYNDVYEVILPPNHRFPMQKYRQVRERVQNRISSLTQEEQKVSTGMF